MTVLQHSNRLTGDRKWIPLSTVMCASPLEILYNPSYAKHI